MDKVQALKNAIEYAKQNPDSPQAVQLRRRIEGGMYNAELAQLRQPQQEKKDGVLKSIVKDVAGTLLVKPAARATEAITRTLAPNSLAAKGYEAMADENQSQKLLGIDVNQQKSFGEGGGRQIAGETLKTASYLFPYGKVAGAVGGAAGASKIAGNVVSGATGGYLADVGYGLSDTEQTTSEALTPGLGTAIGAAIPVVGPTLRATGRGVSKTGEKIVESVIPVSKREAGILQTYKANNPFFKRVADVLSGTEKAPITAGKTATKTVAGQVLPGLFGTKSQIGVQAKRASNSLWQDVISPRLKASEQAVDLDGFFAKVEDDIIKNNPELTRRNSLLEALNAVREDYAGTKVVSLEGLQKLKEGWAKFIPEKAYQGKPIAGAFNDVRNELANEARQTIYSQLGDDVKQAYFDYGNLQGLVEMGKVSMTGQKLKGGTGGLVSELVSQTITPIGTVGGQAVYRIGKGIEFVGNLGAKNLGEALGVNLKFPGDMAVDDISKTIKKAKSLPNKQGGFIKIGQDAKAPSMTQNSQIPNKVKTTSIPKTLPQDKTIVKSIQKAKASGQSFDEWVKGQATELNYKNLQENDYSIKAFGKDFNEPVEYFRAGQVRKNGDIWLTDNEAGAMQYSSAGGGTKVGKYIVQSKKPLIIDTAGGKYANGNIDINKILTKEEIARGYTNNPDIKKKFIDYAKNNGYDAVQFADSFPDGEGGMRSLVVWDKNQIKTRSQLKAEWDKVGKTAIKEIDKIDKFGLTPTMKDNIVEIIDDFRLNRGKNLELQQDASSILEDLGIPLPKKYSDVVKKLEQILQASDKVN